MSNMQTVVYFFFQAEDGIRDADVTGVQTCALPISAARNLCGTRMVVWEKPPRQSRTAQLLWRPLRFRSRGNSAGDSQWRTGKQHGDSSSRGSRRSGKGGTDAWPRIHNPWNYREW